MRKGRNMLLQKVRKVGNSYVVTIPREVMESQGIREGDTVAVEVRKVGHQVRMDPDVRAAFERSMEIYKEDYDYLGQN
jgi:putative addiction module antidote